MNEKSDYQRVYIFLLVVGILLYFIGVIVGAPVPTKRPPKYLSVVGTWNANWRGTDCVMTFYQQGGFECLWYGSDWQGTWEQSGAKIKVSEFLKPSPGNQPSSLYEWEAVLKPNKLEGEVTAITGNFAIGGIFKLTPRKVKPKKADF